MVFQKNVPDQFGFIYPTDSGFRWIKQAGGMSCIQKEIKGIYIPIGKIRYNLGYPNWSPEDPNMEEKLRDINLDSIPQDDFDTIPEYIRDRGYFQSFDEFQNWVDNSETYGWINLWDDLRRFTYGIFDLLDSDPRKRWESADELWDAIDNSLPIEYEELDYSEVKSEGYPGPEAAIRPVRVIKGRDKEYKYDTNWREMEGEVLIMMCPNAD